MRLVDMEVEDYLRLVASDSPAPGGGSASALCGSQGIGLISMVAKLTAGKKKYANVSELCEEIGAEALTLSEELYRQVDFDAEAYNRIADSFRLSKNTEEEKIIRRKAIAEAFEHAAKIPLQTMRLGVKGLRCAEKLIGNYNTNCASDLGCGVYGMFSCVRGAWLNVIINLKGLSDEAAAPLKSEGMELMKSAESLAAKLHEAVLEDI